MRRLTRRTRRYEQMLTVTAVGSPTTVRAKLDAIVAQTQADELIIAPGPCVLPCGAIAELANCWRESVFATSYAVNRSCG